MFQSLCWPRDLIGIFHSILVTRCTYLLKGFMEMEMEMEM